MSSRSEARNRDRDGGHNRDDKSRHSDDKNDRKPHRDDRKGHRDEKRHSLGNETADKIAASTSVTQLFSDAECRVIERKIDEVVAAGANGEYKPCTVDKTPLRNKYFFGEGYIYGGQLKVRGPGNEKLYPKGKVDEIPQWVHDLVVNPIVKSGYLKPDWVNSAVINDYLPGGHIVSHIDPPQLFDRPIITASFLSDSALSFGCRFSFRPLHVTEPVYSLPLKRGGVISFHGYAADEITHCIRPEDTRYRRAVIILRHVPDTAPRLSLEEYQEHMAAEEAKKRGFDANRSFPDLITSHRRPQENWFRGGKSRRSRSPRRRSRSPRRRRRSYSIERSISRSRSRSHSRHRKLSRSRSHSRHRRSRSNSRRKKNSRSKSDSRSSSPSSRRVVLLPGSHVKVKPSVPGFVAFGAEKMEKETVKGSMEGIEDIEAREEMEFQKRLVKLKARGKQGEESCGGEEKVLEKVGEGGEKVIDGDEVIDIQIEESEMTDDEETQLSANEKLIKPLGKLEDTLDKEDDNEEDVEVIESSAQNEYLEKDVKDLKHEAKELNEELRELEDKDLKHEVKELKEELRELKDFIKNIKSGSEPANLVVDNFEEDNDVEEEEEGEVVDDEEEEEVKDAGSDTSEESTVNAVDIIAQEIQESLEAKERKNNQAKNTLKVNAEKKQKLLQAKLLQLKRERRDKRAENVKRQNEKQHKIFEKLKEKEKFSFNKSTTKSQRRKRNRSSSSSSSSSNKHERKPTKLESTTSLIDVLMTKIREKSAAEKKEKKKVERESEKSRRKKYEENFPAAYRSPRGKEGHSRKEKEAGKAGRRSPPYERRSRDETPPKRKRENSPRKEAKERKKSPGRDGERRQKERSYKDEDSSKRKFKHYFDKEMERDISQERAERRERKERAKSPQDEGSSKRKSKNSLKDAEAIESKKKQSKDGNQKIKASQHKVTEKSDKNSSCVEVEKEGKKDKKKSLSELISKKLSEPSQEKEDFATNRRITIDDSEKSYGDFSKLTINVSM